MKRKSRKERFVQILFPILIIALCAVASAQSFDLTVKTQGFGGGKVVVKKADGTVAFTCTIQPASTCTQSLPSGSITLTPVPDANNTFDGWSGATGSATECTGAVLAPCTFTLNANSSIFAMFNTPASLTVRATGPGKATFRMDNGAFITCESAHTVTEPFFLNSNVRINAVPNSGAVFTGWTLVSGSPAGAMCSATSNPCAFVIDKRIFVEAKFGAGPPPPPPPPPPPSLTVNVSKTGSGSGTVTDNQGMSCGTDCSSTAPQGTSIVLKPTASSNSTFTRWTNGTGSAAVCNNSTAKLCAFTLSQNSTITAVFNLTQ